MRKGLIGSGVCCLLVLVSCEEGSPPPPASDIVLESAKFLPINSRDDFEFALKETGDAEGYGFPQSYEAESGRLTYSNDCKAEFLMAKGFAVYPDSSKEQVEELIKSGAAPRTFHFKAEQRNGRVTFLNGGPDGLDIAGPINSDGGFRVVFGTYQATNDYRWSEYEGQFLEKSFNGVFRSHIRDELAEPKGSCTVSAEFHGSK